MGQLVRKLSHRRLTALTAVFLFALVFSLDTHSTPANDSTMSAEVAGLLSADGVYGLLSVEGVDELVPTAGAELKVMSFNLRVSTADKGERSWRARRQAAVDLIMAEEPVVFGVQEAIVNQLNYLRKKCPGYKDVGLTRDGVVVTGENLNVFYNTSRVELLDHGYFWLSETPDKSSYGWGEKYKRGVVWAVFKEFASGEQFLFVNTHCALDHYANAQGMALLMSKIAELKALFSEPAADASSVGAASVVARMEPLMAGCPVVLVADFNILPEDENFDLVRETMLNAREAAPETDSIGTFTWWGSVSRILDHIWFSGFSAARSYRTVTDVYDGVTYVSDHYPITSTLVF